MRLHAFDVVDPVPELNDPHALAVIRPWIDVGSVGSLLLSCLEAHLGSIELAKLARPGNFFDFTRYRPTMTRQENSSEVKVPNTIASYGRQSGGHDFLFLRLLEPHSMAEEYIDSVIELFKALGARRYCLVGSMYDMVPHTRPFLVTGGASNLGLQNGLDVANVKYSDYQGPTTILSVIGQRAIQLGIETCSMIVHLPNYLVMEEDYRGEKRLMEVISSLYNSFSMSQEDMERADAQEQEVRRLAEQIIHQEPRLGLILKQLEANYDSLSKEESEETPLSPEVETFLRGLDKRFRQD
jgi:predicted ATP-grasp superfamily ATP-dependent carboligase